MLEIKVVNDVNPMLMTVLQGYRDHVRLCEDLVARQAEGVMDDGLPTAESLENHVRYIIQLERMMRDNGMVTEMVPVEEVVSEVVPEMVGESVAGEPVDPPVA